MLHWVGCWQCALPQTASAQRDEKKDWRVVIIMPGALQLQFIHEERTNSDSVSICLPMHSKPASCTP
jgi:hypothetical protein